MTTVSADRLAGVRSGLAIKAPVLCATTTNIVLEGVQTIDGVTVVANSRVLVKNQTDATENGIYNSTANAWQRAGDCDGTGDIVQGTVVSVLSGTTQSGWWQVSTPSPVIGSALAFTRTAFQLIDSIIWTLAVTGASAQTLRQVLDARPMHAEAFNVYPNTGADMTSAMVAMLAAIASHGPALLILPRGTLLISGGLSVPSNCVIVGHGRATKIKIADGANFTDNLFKLETVTDSALMGFEIDGNRSGIAGGTQYGVYVGGSQNCRVANMHVHDTSGVGIHSYNSESGQFMSNTCWSNFFHGMEMEQTTNSTVIGNVLRDNLRHGLFVFEGEVGASGSKGVTITGNVMHDNTQSGCIIQGPLCDGISLNNNVLRNNTESGLIVFDRVKRVSVEGNQIQGNGHFGTYLYRTVGANVVGNILKNNSQTTNNGYAEIFLEGDATQYSINNVVANNVITIDGTNKASYHIKENSVNDGPNLIVGNMAIGNGVSGNIAPLHDTGTQTSMLLTKFNHGRVAENRGTATFSSTGGKTYTIAHGLTPDEPRSIQVTPGSSHAMDAAAGGFYATKDATNITVTFGTSPSTGTNNISIHWRAET